MRFSAAASTASLKPMIVDAEFYVMYGIDKAHAENEEVVRE